MPKSRTFYDAVLNEEMVPLANGSREEILAWIDVRPYDMSTYQVCVGRTLTLISVQDYVDEKY